jgi:hypothetical protein
MTDQEFLSTFRNAFTNATYNLNAYVKSIWSRTPIAPHLWLVTFDVDTFRFRCLAWEVSPFEFELFFTLSATRILILDPALEEFKQAAKDIARIGHS